MSEVSETPFSLGEKLIKPGSFFERATAQGADGRWAYRNQPATLGALLKKGERHGAQPLAVWPGRTLTFAEALDNASRIAGGLWRNHGIGRGSRVAIAMGLTPEWIISFMGVLLTGACAIVCDRQALSNRLLADSKADLLLGDVAHEFMPAPPVPLLDWEKLTGLIAQDVSLDAGPPHPDDEALIAFTSGTTGVPKGAISSHRAVITGLMNSMLGGTMAARLSGRKRQPPDRSGPGAALLLTPFSHVSGYSLMLLQFLTGGRIVVPDTMAYSELADLIERENVKSIGGSTPELFAELIENRSDPRLATLSTFNIFGAALSGETMKRVLAAFENASIGTSYGLTETNGPVAMISGEKLLQHSRLAGAIVPTAEIRASDDEGNPLKPGAEGQLWVRGGMLMKGYCNQDSAIDQNGWFRTGDLGWVDADGYVYVSERIGERQEMGEDSLLRNRLEECALSCQGVREAVLMRNASEGLTLALTGDGLCEAKREEVGSAIAKEMTFAARTINIVVIERMPRNAVGKIDRLALRALVS